jgi:hypothetical protein
LFVHAATPDFSIATSPTSQTATQGEANAYTVTVNGLNGFTGTVTLSATGLPSGTTGTFNHNSVSGSGSSALTIYYVSSSGNDSNSGTISAPFKTLGKAQSAMQAGSIKATYLRAGTYAIASTFNLYSADNGEIWATYPGDAANSAILDGGSTNNSNGVDDVLNITGGSNITITGLQIQHFNNSGVEVCGGSNHCGRGVPTANANVVKNNIVHDFYNVYGGGLSILGSTTNTKIYNNVLYNSTSRGIAAVADTKGDNISGTDIENNVVLNTCTASNDEGSIYLQDLVVASSNVTVKNNFVRDYGTAAASTKGIYLDDGLSNAMVTQNIVAGTGTYGAMIHQGANNKIQGNLIDIGGAGNQQLLIYQDNSPKKTLTNMSGNSFASNVVVNTGTTADYAFESIICCSTENPAVQNDVYKNYSGGPVNYQGDPNNVPTFNDGNPVLEDPQCSGWTYNIAYGSPVFNSPVNFPGLPGIWGPPGYLIPHTGTAPSCPH